MYCVLATYHFGDPWGWGGFESFLGFDTPPSALRDKELSRALMLVVAVAKEKLFSLGK